jgi:16S rRNA (cytosine1402-N4)-methyltransferase
MVLHSPVLLNEVLISVNIDQPVQRILDGTFGRGGHSIALLDKFPEAILLAFDRDIEAIQYGLSQYKTYIDTGRLLLVHQDYRNFKSEEWGFCDFRLLDLGVSSPQLDQAERGFSFYHDGPLDMRMDSSHGMTAEEVISTYSEEELIKIFRDYGEIRSPYRVVRALINDRKTKPFTNTQQLSSLIERVDGWKIKGHHPATRYFMALRLEVNQELEGVKEGVTLLMSGLNEGGRLSTITFHSLEDRIVKYIYKDHQNIGFNINKKVIQATDEEIKLNSRARSAKLRIFQKGIKNAGDIKRGKTFS